MKAAFIVAENIVGGDDGVWSIAYTELPEDAVPAKYIPGSPKWIAKVKAWGAQEYKGDHVEYVGVLSFEEDTCVSKK